MGEEALTNSIAAVLGVAITGIVLWLSLRGSGSKRRKHPTRSRRDARRDNDRNVPPDVF